MTGIVILNYQTWDISYRCVKNIIKTQQEILYHIYLVDNASPNPIPKKFSNYLEMNKERITFLQSSKNCGYAAGNNIGINHALLDGCDNLLITNNDILFEKDSVTELIKVLDDEKKIGIAGPKVVNDKGEIQISRCSMKTGIKEIFQIFTVAKKFFRKKWNKYYCLNQNPDKPAFVYYVSGCCFAISRVCALEVTPLDEGTVLYDEELILGIRMEQQGYKTYYNPKSVVVHQHGGTTNQMQPFMHQCICQSELYYCNKYLKAKKWQLSLLYHYRRGLYWIRSRRNDNLREYWNIFNMETKQHYRKMLS